MPILIVDDDTELTDVLSYLLRRAGHDVTVAHNGELAIQSVKKNVPKLVLLDLGLPDKHGLEVCSEVRGQADTPVIILSGDSDDDNIVSGLEAGADDYVTKPFSPRQLLARVQAVLRRSEARREPGEQSRVITTSDVSLDVRRRTATISGRVISLTKLECDLLRELVLHAGQVLSYEFVLDRVWGYKLGGDPSLIKGHIRNLRKKMSEASNGRNYIDTIQGTGYVFQADNR